MRILSIDFDWVMEPCIQVYNLYCRGDHDLGPCGSWNDVKKIIPMIDSLNLEMDYDKFRQLYFFVQDVLIQNPNTPVTIKMNHNEIIPFIEQHITADTTSLELINIDHHHDLGYIDSKNNESIVYGCANWLLYFNDKLNMPIKYKWINNQNSELPENTYENIAIHPFTPYLETINIQDPFDIIFICASWEWVPIKYQPLFNILASMIQERGNII